MKRNEVYKKKTGLGARVLAVVMMLTLVMGVCMYVPSASATTIALEPGLLTVPTVDTANVGNNIMRTMNLLETSTAEHPNTVKIAFYGQSLIDPNNNWPNLLTDYLRAKYPTANVVMKNLAVGGFTASYLKRMVSDDMKDFYPDLTVFMVYGTYTDYTEVVRYIRTYTTSEMMFVDDHFSGGEVNADALPSPSVTVGTTIPQICKEFNCELVTANKYFMQYCAGNKVSSATYLNTDGVHFNPVGQELMFNLIKQFFVYRKPDTDHTFLLNTLKKLEVGKDIHWVNGKLTINEPGNRYVAVMGGASASANSEYGSATVSINGQKPSELFETYTNSRINKGGNYWDIGGFLDAKFLKIPAKDNWTIEITNIDPAAETYTYTLTGEKTGANGTGNSSEVFVSNDGSISIDPADAFTAGGTYTNTDGSSTTGFYKVGNKFSFSTYSLGSDVLTKELSTPANEGNGVAGTEAILASGFTDMDNTVTITADDATKLPNISHILVYRPKLTTETTALPKKMRLIDNSKYVEGVAKPNSLVYLIYGDTVYEKIADAMSGDFMFELSKKVPAGAKVSVYANYFNEKSELVTLVCKPRRPTVKKVTPKSKSVTGKATPKAKVKVTVAGKKFTVKANAKGVFVLKLAKKIRKKLKVNGKITACATINGAKSVVKTIKIKKK